MTRIPNWQSALNSFLVVHRADQFTYGSWDCCLFTCDAIEVMTGVDIACPFRGKYKSRLGATEEIFKYTGKTSVLAITEKLASEYCLEPVPVLKAGRGDAALIQRGRTWLLGIVSLSGAEVIVLGKTGIEAIPLSLVSRAWRV